MNRKLREPKFKKRSALIIFLLIIFFILTLFLFFSSNFFTIKRIEIKSEKIDCANEGQLKDAISLSGQNFFLVNTQNVIKNLLARFTCVGNINLSRSFPDKIKLEFIGREPVATLINLQKSEASVSALVTNIATPSAEQIQQSYSVDSEGVIFAKLEGELNIPKIYVFDLDIKENNLRNELIASGLKILDRVRTFGLEVQDTWIKDDIFLINSIDGEPKVIFRLNSTIDVQIASLQLILQKAKIDENRLEFIDLRFDKPVVKFAPKK